MKINKYIRDCEKNTKKLKDLRVLVCNKTRNDIKLFGGLALAKDLKEISKW